MTITKLTDRFAELSDQAAEALIAASKKKNAFDKGVEAIQLQNERRKDDVRDTEGGIAAAAITTVIL